MFRPRSPAPAGIALALGLALAWPAASQLDEAVGVRVRAQTEGSQSQVRIDQLGDETDRLLADYRTALQRIEALRVYNHQLTELRAAQQEEMARLRGEIDGVTIVGRQITPLLLRMIEALDVFVELDVPFLEDERGRRVAGLRELMLRADVTDAEKFRRVLEAYQIENDYGRSIEAYRGELESGAEKRQVDFLRIGRLALYYQTLDGAEMGLWDQRGRAWVTLGDEHRIALRQGLRMARKQVAPDLLRLPIASPEDAG